MLKDIALHVYVTHFIDTQQTLEREQQRRQYLATEILYLSMIDVGYLEVTIFSNSPIIDFDELSKPIFARSNKSNISNYVATTEEISENGKVLNWLLTWVHKVKMKKDVESGKGNSNNYFLYLEDDALFTESNLRYFLEFQSEMKRFGLIPGFLRSEWSKLYNCWTHPDSFSRLNSLDDIRPFPSRQDLVLVQRNNPFSASILLDQDLAEEYFTTESAIQQLACYKHPIIFDIGSTAALGLICENIPSGYKHRTAVVHNSKNYFPLPGSIIRHLDDRYGNDLWQRHFRLFDDLTSEPLIKRRTLGDYLKRLKSEDRVYVISSFIRKLGSSMTSKKWRRSTS